MSSPVSSVPPRFGAQGPCAVHRWCWGWQECPGGASGLGDMSEVAGHPLSSVPPSPRRNTSQAWEQGAKGEREGGSLRDPAGSPGSHWWVTSHFCTGNSQQGMVTCWFPIRPQLRHNLPVRSLPPAPCSGTLCFPGDSSWG